MKKRRLGNTGPIVSAIGLGCVPMSGIYGWSSDAEAVATIQRALDLGVTLLDTADVYGAGHNEELVGRAIRGRRDEVVLATKFGSIRTPGRQNSVSGRPEYVKKACEASLARLGVDTIDLYQQHRVDPDTPIEETVGALAELVREGKILHIGLSAALSPDIRRAAATHPVATVQSEYSLLERDVERDVIGTCEELGIGFLAYAPLMRGLLGGALRAGRPLDVDDARSDPARFPRVGPEYLSVNEELVRVVGEIASGRGVSPAEVALAWLLSRRPWVVPIPGTKRVAYLEENVRAPELTLCKQDELRLEGLATCVQGARYGEGRLPERTSPPPGR